MILVSGGDVLTDKGFQAVDVLVADGEIVDLGPSLTPALGTQVLDARGCLVGPGFVDIHVHFREPGQTWKEDIESGSRSAAAGGFTAVVAMPNTEPAVDTPDLVRQVRERGCQVGLVDVVPAGAITRGRLGKEVTDLESLHRDGVRVFSDDGDSLADDATLGEVMARLAKLEGAVLSQHAEDAGQTSRGHMHQGELSRRLGMGGLPTDAETEVVARDLELVTRTGARYHCQHVSAAATVDLIGQAKVNGLPVTAEVAPHHLSFDVSCLNDLDPNFKMYPPLRDQRDKEALRRALNDGTIDAVATDHAPHTPAEKAVSFEDAPRGVIGLETAAAVAHEVVGDRLRFFEVMAMAPARIAGIEGHGQPVGPGRAANIVVFDPDHSWIVERFRSKSANSPYLGRALRGIPVATIFQGRLVHQMEAVR